MAEKEDFILSILLILSKCFFLVAAGRAVFFVVKIGLRYRRSAPCGQAAHQSGAFW
jgi:hypothetical protein